MTITVDFQASRIQVSANQVALDVGALYEAIKDVQKSEKGVMYPPIAAGAGKFDLGGGRTSGLVVRLNSPWQIEFLGSGQRSIDGGTLIGGLGGQPIASTPGTQVILNRPADAFGVTTNGSSSPSSPGGVTYIDPELIHQAIEAALHKELSKIYVPSTGTTTSSSPMTATLVHTQNSVGLVQRPSTGSLVNSPNSGTKNPF